MRSNGFFRLGERETLGEGLGEREGLKKRRGRGEEEWRRPR